MLEFLEFLGDVLDAGGVVRAQEPVEV